MNAIPATPVTLGIARRVIWFESPETALANPVQFMAYAMTYARHEDMRVIRQLVSDDDFREALDNAPPGIIDPRSWAYWNLRMGRYPPHRCPGGLSGALPITTGGVPSSGSPDTDPARAAEGSDQHPRQKKAPPV